MNTPHLDALAERYKARAADRANGSAGGKERVRVTLRLSLQASECLDRMAAAWKCSRTKVGEELFEAAMVDAWKMFEEALAKQQQQQSEPGP